MHKERIIVTGGAGFIGSNFINYMVKKYADYLFINVDKLTYSGNLNNLKELEYAKNYQFIKADICESEEMSEILKEGDILVNFAAESHVDNSLLDPYIFIKTNVVGTQNLLDISRKSKVKKFIQISTDEVYGSLSFDAQSSKENHILKPSSPYSASKAAAEMLCLAAVHTHNQFITITRSSNNFGPYQFPEKVIPLFVTNLILGKKVPLYGSGKNVRDWLFVLDNCEAIDMIIHKGNSGEVYNIGGGNEVQNIDLTNKILIKMGKDHSSIEYVEDRKGHDLRYSIDCLKIKSLGWTPKHNFDSALEKTINWYKENVWWWEPLKNTKGKRTS
ncbi:MAG: dTDP-glucose 4,6-dehydratase [Nanoarchaeota archaeon]